MRSEGDLLPFLSLARYVHDFRRASFGVALSPHLVEALVPQTKLFARCTVAGSPFRARRLTVKFAFPTQKEGAEMGDKLLTSFAIRCNEDGSWDLICSKCFLTIATERREEELQKHEKDHNCDALLRERRGARILEPIRGRRL